MQQRWVNFFRFLACLLCAKALANAPTETALETVKPPRSIAREILQPIGMPVVSLFHSMKENLFLNHAHEEATGLEAAGDWLLSPCR